MCELGDLKVLDLADNPGKFFRILEIFGNMSASSGIKTGVQFILWGGSVLFLVRLTCRERIMYPY